VTGAHAAAPPTGVEAQFLDAAELCLHRRGIRRTTMVQVADEAGLSRAWLYRHFPDKASLLGAALIRQDEQFWTDARARISRRTTLSAQLAEAVTYSREQEASALVLKLRATEPSACAEIMGIGLRQSLPGMAAFWRPFIERARDRGELRAEVDVIRAAEFVMRFVLSLVTVPGDAVDVDDADAVRSFAQDFVVAGLR
jgi:AcrR family transcriptional regulator